MADKKAQPKVYFNCLPKDQVLQFFADFKTALTQIPKSDEKKNMDFEDKAKFNEFFDTSKDHIKNSLVVCTASFKVNDESAVAKIKEVYDKLAPMFQSIRFVKKHPENYALNFRNNGTQIFIDFSSVKGEFPSTSFRLRIRY